MSNKLPTELQNVDPRLTTPSIRSPRPLITKEGWRDFVNFEPVAKPPLVPLDVVQTWSKEQCLQYQAIRKRYHAMQQPLTTPSLTSITEAVVRLALTGMDLAPGVRPGALINGLPTLGKSTILAEIGRKYERVLRLRLERSLGTEGHAEFIPVVYTTLASNETCKGLTTKLLNYYGRPYNRNDSESDLQAQLARQASQSGTTLMLVDDVHFLDNKHRSAKDVNTHLKALASSIGATFVYAGVNLEGTGLLFEGQEEAKAQAAQTQRRFRRMEIMPFEATEDAFVSVLEALETQLLLLKGEPGDLTGLAKYVHDRTDGYMGAITSLVRDGAALAIETGAERITKSVLDLVTLDYASQKRFVSLVSAGSKAA
jgi:hypothetical protein